MKEMKLFNVSLYYGMATVVATNKQEAMNLLKGDSCVSSYIYDYRGEQIVFDSDIDEIPDTTVLTDKPFVVNYYKE